MHKSENKVLRILSFSFVVALGAAFMISCGGSSQPTSATTGTVKVSMTDPATCSDSFDGGVWVTVTKVMANINGNAAPNGSGWQPLVDLTSSPMQINLLSLADSESVCLLKLLGSSGPLPPGKYQQIRLYLLSNNPGPGVATPTSTNECGNQGWNCVKTGKDPSTATELQLPSQVQTGIKIPSTNITSGGLTVAAGESTDLNIDFQSCASIVNEGNGQYRLKPVLYAGEVSQNMNSISGQVVVSGTTTPVGGATVLFEQPSGGTEVIKDSTTTDSNGNFFACPLPGTANYDIVVAAQTGSTGSMITYNPTVAFNIPLGTNLGPGTNLGTIPLVAANTTPDTTNYGGAAPILGQADTDAAVPVSLTSTLPLTKSSSLINVVIPALGVSDQPPSVMTALPPAQSLGTVSPPTSCAGGSTDCYNFQLLLPPGIPDVGTFDSTSGSISYSVLSSAPTPYTVTAASGDCTSGTAAGTDNTFAADMPTLISPDQLVLSGCTAPPPTP